MRKIDRKKLLFYLETWENTVLRGYSHGELASLHTFLKDIDAGKFDDNSERVAFRNDNYTET